MFNDKTVGRLNLTARTYGATDQAGDVHPDMVGVMYCVGGDGRHKDVIANFEVNEVTGKQQLDLLIPDNGDGTCLVGKLMRDETAVGKDQYVGYLRERNTKKLEDMAVDYFSDWQLQISVEATLLSYGIPGLSGNVFPPNKAVHLSVNAEIRKSKLGF